MTPRIVDNSENVDGGSFRLGCIGLGLAIAGTEALRYSSLWTVGENATLPSLLVKVIFILISVGALALLSRSGRKLSDRVSLLVTLSILQMVGLSARFVELAGYHIPDLAYIIMTSFAESGYLLLIVYALYFLEWSLRQSISALIAGVILAGALQICIVAFSRPLAFVITLSFVPVSAFLLWSSSTRKQHNDEWFASLSEDERSVFEDIQPGGAHHRGVQMQQKTGEAHGDAVSCMGDGEPGVCVVDSGPDRKAGARSRLKIYLVIMLSSYLVAMLHAHWLGAQDNGFASSLIQICAATGEILAGNLFILLRSKLQDRDFIDILWLIILPVSLAVLYLTTFLSGALISLSVIPLNIVYVSILFLTWITPKEYPAGAAPSTVCVSSFLSKKLGIYLGLAISLIGATLGNGWIDTTMTTIVLVALVTLCLLYFISTRMRHSDEQVDSSPIDSDVVFKETCKTIAESYRLTPREADVLVYLARGRTASYIARKLFISDATAKTHIMHIYQKMGIKSQQVLMDLVEEGR